MNKALYLVLGIMFNSLSYGQPSKMNIYVPNKNVIDGDVMFKDDTIKLVKYSDALILNCDQQKYSSDTGDFWIVLRTKEYEYPISVHFSQIPCTELKILISRENRRKFVYDIYGCSPFVHGFFGKRIKMK